MNRPQLAIVPFLIFHSAADAQSGPCPTDGTMDQLGRGQYSDARLLASRNIDRTVKNANDFAPDRASAVWSATSSLVGYTCLDTGGRRLTSSAFAAGFENAHCRNWKQRALNQPRSASFYQQWAGH